MTEVERFGAVSDDGEEITIVKYKRPPLRDVNGNVVQDVEEYDYALTDGTRVPVSAGEDIFWIPSSQKTFKRREKEG